MKFGVCAILKNENLYLREWVEHYISLGFDKIIIYDNNDIRGEIPNTVIQDYIDSGIVDLYNHYRGKHVTINENSKTEAFVQEVKIQMDAYNECLEKYKKELDWIAFLDIDEFLQLVQHKKIQHVFEDINYYGFHNILVCANFIGDDNRLYYTNEPLAQRFTTCVNGVLYGSSNNCNSIFKCIASTHYDDKFTVNVHCRENSISCNASLYTIHMNNYTCFLHDPDYDIMYYKHYYTKSLTEFLYKFNYYSWSKLAKNVKLDNYKILNGWSEEHEKVYQNFLKQNNIEAPK